MLETTTIKEEAQWELIGLHEKISNAACYNDSFLSGKLGLAYYYCNRYLIYKDLANMKREAKEALCMGRRLINDVFNEFNRSNTDTLSGPFLSMGATGFAYVTDYLCRHHLIDFDAIEECKELDEYLFESARKAIGNDQLDYLHGAMGVLLYFTLQQPRRYTITYITTLVNDLMAKVITTKNGAYFYNSNNSSKDKEQVNLSLSHGLSGILLILMQCLPYLKKKEKPGQAIYDGIWYILNSREGDNFSEEHFSHFPVAVNGLTGKPRWLNRLAWCYGDMNQILLLYRAGALFRDPYYTTIAREAGANAFSRSDYKTNLVDNAWFCHGSSGLAQIFKTLYKETGDRMYWDRYTYWINKTNSLWQLDPNAGDDRFNGAGLLEGYAGAALVLCDYQAKCYTDWSRIFLL